jgi:hypothetical protein
MMVYYGTTFIISDPQIFLQLVIINIKVFVFMKNVAFSLFFWKKSERWVKTVLSDRDRVAVRDPGAFVLSGVKWD